MASLEIQKFQSIEVDFDLITDGCISCANHIFVGRLCMSDLNGFKVYKLKDTVPTVLKHFDPNNEKFSHGDHSTCSEWYRRAVQEGYVQHITQLFPRAHLIEDFEEVDYDFQIADLYEKYNSLDNWLQTDAEAAQILLTALQAAGDIATVIDQKVAAEASLRTSEDNAQKARLDLIEADDWVTTARVQDGQLTFAKCAADVCSKAQLDLEASSRQSADSSLSIRLDTAEGKVSYTDPVSQTQVTSQIATEIANLVASAPSTFQRWLRPTLTPYPI